MIIDGALEFGAGGVDLLFNEENQTRYLDNAIDMRPDMSPGAQLRVEPGSGMPINSSELDPRDLVLVVAIKSVTNFTIPVDEAQEHAEQRNRCLRFNILGAGVKNEHNVILPESWRIYSSVVMMYPWDGRILKPGDTWYSNIPVLRERKPNNGAWSYDRYLGVSFEVTAPGEAAPATGSFRVQAYVTTGVMMPVKVPQYTNNVFPPKATR